MEAYYKVMVTYPSGKTEEVDDTFKTGQEALEFGKTILGQIPFNEGFHSSAVDEFGDKEYIDPYFEIVKVTDGKGKIVFDSRYPD